MRPEQIELLDLIGDLWAGDWSGRNFDGNDGSYWIHVAVNGGEATIRDTIAGIKKLREEWYSLGD